jgi:hypothetical protein
VGVVGGIFWAAWREWTVLGLLARDRARSSNSAENFERYVIFLGSPLTTIFRIFH